MIEQRLIEFQKHGDDRGELVALEYMKDIPFKVERVYYIFDTKLGSVRGCHAHKALEQILICLKGSCTLSLEDFSGRKEYLLKSPFKGVFISGLIWREIYDFSDDCILLVLSSECFDENDYIRDYAEFKNRVNKFV